MAVEGVLRTGTALPWWLQAAPRARVLGAGHGQAFRKMRSLPQELSLLEADTAGARLWAWVREATLAKGGGVSAPSCLLLGTEGSCGST